MQKKQKYWTGIIGIIWVAGLLIAGSESPYMPWMNIIGLILFFIASLMLEKLIQPIKQNHDFPISNSFHRKIVSKPVKTQYCVCD
jgi:Sec-independent protein secretion pathway component TatC